MYIALTIVIVFFSLLLTFFVLVQNSKGGGLAAGFTSSNQIMGVRKTTDFLEKATWGLVVAVVLLSILAVPVRKQSLQVQQGSEISDQAQKAQQTAPGVVTPDFGEKPEAAKPAAPVAPAK